MLCNKCNVEITELNKVKGRNSCKECEKKRRRDYMAGKRKELKDKLCEVCVSKNANEYCEECKKNYSKKCETCQEIKLFNQFVSINHKKCKDCSPKRDNMTKQEWVENNPDIKERKCITCNETKVLTRFSYHINNFRNQCKDCINLKKDYETYRTKKRAEDEEAYVAHNTQVAREWRNKNRESYQEYCKKYRATLRSHVLNVLKKKSKQKQDNNEELYTLFEKLMLSDCAYCGVNDSLNAKYNGIDRIDSTKCYTPENCNPCCFTCNMIKNTMDVGSLLRKCVEISVYNKLNEIKEDDYRLKFHEDKNLVNTNTTSYTVYKNKAKSRNIHFELSKEEFANITKTCCYLCGTTNEGKKIGIDRIDNNVGYILDNCKSCCKYCNYMKKDLKLNDFLMHIKQIVSYTTENEDFKDNSYTFYGILQKTKHHFK